MRYQLVPMFHRPYLLNDLSQKLIESHYENNYGGALRRLNAITQELASLDFKKAPGYVVNDLKREELIAMNSTLLHELYFASLGLAVKMPAAFAAQYVAGATHLQWTHNLEPDLAGYRLYRGTSPGFKPDTTSLVAIVPDTTYVDAANGIYYYKLTAANRSSLESPSALLAPGATTAVDPARVPGTLFLAAPKPNPARSAASFRFGLPRESEVSLAVYDVHGRLGRDLVRSRYTAGEHSAGWDLRNAGGAAVSGGLYFIRLNADGAARTARVAVVR